MRRIALAMLMCVLAVGSIASASCVRATNSESSRTNAVLLFGIGIHIEPLNGERLGQGDYRDPVFFRHHVEDIRILAKMVERYGAKLTVQAQTPFTVKWASPVTYASNDDPPFLILQGAKDALVPARQSLELYDRLRAVGVSVTLVIVKNAGHGFAPVGGRIKPTRAEITGMVADFFDEHLKQITGTHEDVSRQSQFPLQAHEISTYTKVGARITTDGIPERSQFKSVSIAPLWISGSFADYAHLPERNGSG